MNYSGGSVGVAIAFAAVLGVGVPMLESGVPSLLSLAATVPTAFLMLLGAAKIEKYFSEDKEEQQK